MSLSTGCLGLALVVSACSLAPASAQDGRLGDIDASVERTRSEFQVPGLALAIVKDGRVVLAKGYGVRRHGEPAPVGPHTLFGIASNTKAMTCAAIAMLAAEGKLAWDDPVTRHLPGFQMYDPFATREVTLRDLVTHRAGLGLGGGDLLFWPETTFTRAEIVSAIRHLKPASSLRSRYAYSNVMYVVAGEVVAAVSGRSWDDFVKERLLAPLGMTRSTTGLADSGAGDDFASPHVVLDGSVQPVTAVRIDNAAAAGGVHSSASEMARWVRMLLECGPGGKASGEGCLLSSTAIGEMWSPQTIRPISTAPRGLETLQPSFSAYGLGFGLLDHRGRKLVTHTGGLPGYVSRVALVPQERLGLVVLTNQEAEGAHTALLYHVLDLYLGAPKPPVDWVAAFKRAAADDLLRAKEAVAKASGARDAASRPSLTLSRYSGRYRDAWYGEAAVVEEQGRLVLRLSRTPRMVADLEHWQHDTFVARWRERFMSDAFGADAYVTFALNPDGSIERFRMAPVSPAVDFSFDYQDLLFTPLPAEGR